jgi:hypothetical protein
LELGTHLVRELGLIDSNDTLSRWLAHHLAELMTAVEKAEAPAGKAAALNQATEVIAQLWKNREVLPGHANPLARYREALAVLSEFEERQYFPGIKGVPKLRGLTDKVARDAERLQLLTRLIDAVPTNQLNQMVDKVALEALDDEEILFLDKISKWLSAGARTAESEPAPEELPILGRALRLLTGMVEDLREVEKELGSKR